MSAISCSISSCEGIAAKQSPIRPCWVDGSSGVGGELMEQEGDPEQTEEARVGKARVPPKAPSAEEMRLHRLTHYPFRSWCPVCVAARGKSWPHLRMDDEAPSEVPTICFDYCFLRDEIGGQSIPVLV